MLFELNLTEIPPTALRGFILVSKLMQNLANEQVASADCFPKLIPTTDIYGQGTLYDLF